MIRTGRDSAYANLTAEVFTHVWRRLDDVGVARWLHSHQDAELTAETYAAILANTGAAVEDAVVAMVRLPRETVDQLCSTGRAVVARTVATRDDLAADQLRRLLTRDDAATSAAVWDNAACTDELRALILTGRTMNPRARADKLVAVPRAIGTIPRALLDVAAASACPAVRAKAWPGKSDAARRDRALAVLDAVLTQIRSSSPGYTPKQLVVQSNRAASDLVTAHDQLLAEIGRQIRSHDPRCFPSESDLVEIERALRAGDALDAPADDREAVADELRRGGVTPATVAELDDLCGLTYDQLHQDAVAVIAEHRPDLLTAEQLLAFATARRRSLPLSAAAVRRIAAAGLQVPATAVRATSAGALSVAEIAAVLVPAASVLRGVSMPAARNQQLGQLLSDVLGGDPVRWDTFETLVDDFDGSVAELLDTVVTLTDGEQVCGGLLEEVA